MRKKLILIMSDGGKAGSLDGVHIDERNYLNFFKSPEGGAWTGDEIKVYNDNNFFLSTLIRWILNANEEHKPYDFFFDSILWTWVYRRKWRYSFSGSQEL